MRPENPKIPDWARRERLADLDWIAENLDLFWTAAITAFEDVGRGAIVVDTTHQPTPDAGHLFAYFSQERIEEEGDEDTRRIVAEYDPEHEFVVVLLKPDDHISTYRLRAVLPESQETATGEITPGHTGEPAAEPKLTPPDVETLIEWEFEGGCEAACPHQCWVEPDGVCSHGNPSWLFKLGLI